MSFLDSIVEDMKSMGDGSWKEKVVPKRKEPSKPTFVEDDNWDKDIERYDKKRKIEREKKQEEQAKRKQDPRKRKAENKEILDEMSLMFGRPRPVQRRKSGSIDLGDKPIIDNIAKCKVAVIELSKYPLIAVDCEWAGPRDTLREQELCLVQIADPKNKAYLFDVHVVGKDLFDKGGLKGLLENPNIIKIFHDCRWDSDILWHQMGVRITNIFDTQIGYACYRRQQESITPLPTGLKNLVKTFALGGTHSSKEEAKLGMEKEQDYWKIRPMTEIMMQYAREDVLLLPLVYRQINAILSASSRTVANTNSEAYVTMRRDKTTEELEEIRKEERQGLKEGERPLPRYGIPDWDRAAKVSLDRSNVKSKK